MLLKKSLKNSYALNFMQNYQNNLILSKSKFNLIVNIGTKYEKKNFKLKFFILLALICHYVR